MTDRHDTRETGQPHGHHYGAPLQVTAKDGELVIRIGTVTLAHAVTYSDWANPYDEKSGDYIRLFAITDVNEFASDVARMMLAEREDGSSPLSDFLDKMTEAAVDDGSTACEHDQRIKHGERAAIEVWPEPPVAALPPPQERTGA